MLFSLCGMVMNLASQLMKLCTDYVWHTVTWQRITPTRTRLNTCLNSMIHMRLTTTTLVEIALCNWFRELRPDTTCSVVATSLKSWRWSLIVSFRGRTLLPLNMYAPWTVTVEALWGIFASWNKSKRQSPLWKQTHMAHIRWWHDCGWSTSLNTRSASSHTGGVARNSTTSTVY